MPIMSIAAGGSIHQSIHPDFSCKSDWDPNRTVILNVQILNAELFEGVTGLPPPTSPITASTYADEGMPYYMMYDEIASSISGNFALVKSVAELDKDKGTDASTKAAAEVANNTHNPIITLNSNGPLLPFRHISDI